MANTDDSGKSSPYREAVTTRLTPQNYERYENYAEKHGYSKSEALRQLVRVGLDQDEGNDTDTTQANMPIHDMLIFAGLLSGVITFSDNVEPVYLAVSAALLAIGIILQHKGISR
jgi:hypothetical protein